MASNYLVVGQIYLMDKNPLLKQPLKPDHVKSRLLGHFGTCPGQNFIYVHLNRIICERKLSMFYVCGPGHGGPAMFAQTYLEGSFTERYPDISKDEEGIGKLFKQFSFPGGFPSHAAPETPGSIHEGGELGYSLSHAFGAVFDKPDLIVACVVGDGEAETGPLATSWHSNKFLNPAKDGAVLPILHLNGFKIANPVVLARIPEEELLSLFRGYGYNPVIVEGSDPAEMHPKFAAELDYAVDTILSIQKEARTHLEEGLQLRRPTWPVILLKTPKGWTGPSEVDGVKIEGSYKSHQVPVSNPSENLEHLDILEKWLRSYQPENAFDDNGKLLPELQALVPPRHLRMGSNPYTNPVISPLILPSYEAYGVKIDKNSRGKAKASDTFTLGTYLRDVIIKNVKHKNFRIFSPDETASNRLHAVYEATNKQWMGSLNSDDDTLADHGRVIEMLSEHQCEGWLEGYLLTGGHGLLNSYEAFIHIVSSMFNQHAKWLKICKETPWRNELSSLNILLSSHVWRQDHNGFTHQDPGFLQHVASKKPGIIRIYLPPDGNCLLSVMDHCLSSRHYVNIVVAGKHPSHQWLTPAEATEHCTEGIGIWKWASNDIGREPDIIVACAGDVPTLEALAAVSIVRKKMPEFRIRFINVVDLMKLTNTSHHPHGLSNEKFDSLFTTDKPVLFDFHAYPELVEQLIFCRSNRNFTVRGYKEEGTMSTPFDGCVMNGVDRFHLVIDICNIIEHHCRTVTEKTRWLAPYVSQDMRQLLAKHKKYIHGNGVDLEEVADWEWEC